MKTPLLALSLVASSSLIATGASNSQICENGYCNTCCCSPCCCEPCCVPQPKPCIDCECYSPAFYDLQCDWGVSIDLEFLYWYARETNLSYAAKLNNKAFLDDLTTPLNLLAPSTFKHVGTTWDPGFRVGLGWNSSCDGWDSYLTWTWMRNRKKSSTSVPEFTNSREADSVLINPWDLLIGTSPEGFDNYYDHVSGAWRLRYNQIDWELGRKFWNSACFAIRPYVALRGAWWKTRFRTTSKRTIPETGSTPQEAGRFFKFKDRFHNRTWGVGLLGGLQPTWYFCSNFALYGNFDVALIWGRFKVRKKENYFVENTTTETETTFTNSSKSHFSAMTPMLDTSIGLRWEETWCCDQYRTALDLGWEHHVLFDQNHRMKMHDLVIDIDTQTVAVAGTRSYEEQIGNISMGGFVLRLRFDF